MREGLGRFRDSETYDFWSDYRVIMVCWGMVHTFTSLRHPLEKLREAEYFLAGVASTNNLEFQFNLNAFVSSCRSVTFIMQKSLSDVPGFAHWYRARQSEMKADPAMGFFLELRNISQHEGPVSYVGGSTMDPNRWSYRFAGNREAVPATLVGKEVAEACADHLTKLARLLLDCVRAFPFACCPVAAMSPDGMAALGYNLDDVGAALALPPGYLDAGMDIPMPAKLRILAREFDPLEVEIIERIVSGDLRINETAFHIPSSSGSDLTDIIANMIENRGDEVMHPRNVFVAAIMKRIDETEK